MVEYALHAAQAGLALGFGLSYFQMFVGSFFALSGFHKLFNADKHEQMVRAQVHAKVPFPRHMAWVVSGIEFLGGLALIFHFGVGIAAAALFGVMLVAWSSEVKGRLAKGAPYAGWPILGKCAAVYCMAESIYLVALIAILIG